jgi:signal transduction histidine kinase
VRVTRERIAGSRGDGPTPAKAPLELLRQTADVLSGLAAEISARWIERLQATIYAGRPDLEAARSRAPALVQGVADALRAGRPKALGAPWTRAARQHAELRLAQQVPLGDLVREYQLLREEIWAALRQHLQSVSVSGVYDLAQDLDAILDTMLAIAATAYGAELQRVTDRLYAVQRITEAQLSNLPLDQLLDELLERIREALDADTARLLLLTDDGRHLVLHASRGLRLAPGREPPIPVGEGIAGHVAQTRQPLIVDDPSRVEVVSPLVREKIRSLAAVPLEVEKRIIGVVDVGTVSPHHYTADDVQLLQAVAVRAATAIDRKRAEDERNRLLALEREKTAQLEALRRVTDPALARRGTDELIRTLLESAVTTMQADTGALLLLDPTGQELVLQASAGIPAEQVVGRTARVGEGFPGQVAARNAILWVRDAQVDPLFSNPLIRASRIRAMLGAPLWLRDELYGVIVVAFRQAREFGPHEEGLLAVVAERAGQAIHQARLLEEARQAQSQTARSLATERRAREQAEAAVRARDDFLAASAHELKTPITNLRGYAQLTMRRLEREAPPGHERVRRALRTIDLQSGRLARLVQQLLDVASIDAGQLRLHRRETDLVPLVRGGVEGIQAGTRRHTLTLHAPPSIRALVDPERIESVVANLLDNAVKFGPPGTPVEVELATPEPDTVRLSVRDYGPGIPPELRAQLFNRFFQAQTGRPFAGLGLGLYYSRHIVELHGGRIWAEFPEDGGSRFVVELPRRGAGATEGAPAERRDGR